MKTFYLFLDIDGVLWDWPYLKKEIDEGRVQRGGIIEKLKPESIKSLNFLIEKLSNEYDVKLVISSSWRYDMDRTLKILKEAGLNYNKEVDRTVINFETRGIQIKKYLKGKQDYKFVIIDDEYHDFRKLFKKENIIKTDVMEGALSITMVEEYLNRNKKNIGKRI